MVGAAVQVPIKENGVAGGDVGISPRTPLSVRLEPRDALGLAGSKAGFGKPHLAIAPGHETGAPFHTGCKAIPAPIGLAAHISHLAFSEIHHSLIAGPGTVHKFYAGQILGITHIRGAAPKDQGLVPQGCPVDLVHFQLVRGQKL